MNMSNLNEAFLLVFIGLSGVFLVLGFFYVLLITINKVSHYFNKIKVDKKLKAKPVSTSSIPNDEIDPEIVAVIASAILVTLKTKVKIKSIKFLTSSDDTSWSRIGRLSLIESHNISVK